MSKINHPKHYNMGPIEVIDAIESWGLGFNLGNAVKYIARFGHKPSANAARDLEKAKWYLERHLAGINKKIKPEDWVGTAND